MNRLRRTAYLAAAALAVFVGTNAPFGGTARAQSIPLPREAATMQTPPPLSATATPTPSGTLVKYSGEILDYSGGFVFFTTGDAFRADAALKIDDAATGGPTKLVPGTGVYARASFDQGSGGIVELALSERKLPDEATYDQIKKFAVALSATQNNPDLTSAEGFNGRGVGVTFFVEVPPKTPFTDQIYLSTDASGWSATAIRMDRVDALHYKAVRSFPSGTKLLYLYTRGTFQSAEINNHGLVPAPRVFLVRNSDVKIKNDVVYGWQDQNAFAQDNGSVLPTPFNPVPFNIPPHH